jgi:hypothetical protein
MCRALFFVAACFGFLTSAPAAPTSTHTLSTNRILTIDRCTANIAGGKATLTVGPLRPTGDTYSGDYSMKVSPYFFKNEKGRLAILIPSESIEKASKGVPVNVTGKATENGKKGKVLKINATATPTDSHQGELKLWFIVDEKKMVFQTRYRFVEQKGRNLEKSPRD